MTMMMKNSVILATCVVLLSSLIVQASESSFGPDQCCFKFYTRPLPKKKVEALQYTGKLCPMEGVLFKMRNGAVLCVDPSAAWVKPIIEAKEKQMAKKLSTPTPTGSS
ncbi:C-C motif chemokine 5-like [Mugil cephalus]|uniref:C-C motif chemokine 5-like n=1 Tax=Mugil cephalus TaxID=48193 RepID=UPI001FB6C5E9|nr:C-C motif chemokine 5-like [Mugil cephalus]